MASATPIPPTPLFLYSVQDEEDCVGCLLKDPATAIPLIEAQCADLAPIDFYRSALGEIYQCILTLYRTHGPRAVLPSLIENRLGSTVASADYLGSLSVRIADATLVTFHASIIRDYALRRYYEQLSPNLAAAIQRGDSAGTIADWLASRIIKPQASIDAKPRRFRPLSISEIRERPPVPMLIGGVLSEGGLSMISAPEDNYKSFTALDIGASVATGQAWAGIHMIHHQGTVVYIAGEGVSGMSSRIAAWEQEHKRSLDGKLFMIENSPQLLDSREVDELIDELKSLPEPPVLLINDTLACSIAGADENSTQDMTVAEQAVKRIRRALGCHVMNVHHDGKSGAVRGASSFIYAMDTRLSVKRDRDTDSVIVTCEKQKDSERFRPITFAIRRVTIGDDIHHTSLVLMPTQAAPVKPKLMPTQLRALEALKNGMRNSEWQAASGIPEGTFGRIARQLVASGYVNKQHDGYHLTHDGEWILSQLSDSYRDSRDTIDKELSSLSPPFRGDSDDSSLDRQQDPKPKPTLHIVINNNAPIDEPDLPDSDMQDLRDEAKKIATQLDEQTRLNLVGPRWREYIASLRPDALLRTIGVMSNALQLQGGTS